MTPPKITSLELHEYEYTLKDMGTDYNGFNWVYEPDGRLTDKGYVLRVLTDSGLVGEYAGGSAAEYSTLPTIARYLLGKNALERERIYTDVKRALRQEARLGIAPIDIALWDLAGKVHNAPVRTLLGGYKQNLPCYASTYHGDNNGGLSSPEAFADFAQH